MSCCIAIRNIAIAAYCAAGIVSTYLLYLTFGIGCMVNGYECWWFFPYWQMVRP